MTAATIRSVTAHPRFDDGWNPRSANLNRHLGKRM
jgi:hypothetical protein